MGVSQNAKEFCMHNLVSMATEIMTQNTSISAVSFLEEFSKSKTYAKLYDPKTRLWAEGPNYILGLYAEEKGLNFSFLDY